MGVELGVALAAVGREGQAVTCLQRSIVAGGEYDHPLTSVVLLELGRLAMIRGDFNTAGKYFAEASYSAVNYPDPGVLEEALRYGAMAHLMANRRGIFPPLATAIPWAKTNHLRQLHASLLLLAAENFAVLGQTAQAAQMLDQARTTIARRAMGSGRIGRTAELPRRAGLLPAEQAQGRRTVRSHGHGLHGRAIRGSRRPTGKRRLALDVPDRPGRRDGPHQCHGAGGHGYLQGGPPRSAVGRLVFRSDGVVGRAGYAAPAAL